MITTDGVGMAWHTHRVKMLLARLATPWLLVGAVFVVLDIALLHPMLAADGIPMHGDLAFPLSLQRYEDHFYPLWNPYSSVSNLENMNRLLLMVPLIRLADTIGASMGSFVKGVFFVVLMLSQVSMYLWVTQVLRLRQTASGNHSRFVGVVAACMYGFSPWVMPRMSAMFFWIAYALAPLLLVCMTKGLAHRHIGYLLAAAFIWSMGSGSPQFTLLMGVLAFLWAGYLLKTREVTLVMGVRGLVVMFGAYLAFNAYWLWPAIRGWGIQPLTPGYTVSAADLQMFSINATPVNVFLGRDDWFKWWTSTFVDGPGLAHAVWVGIGLVLAGVALSSLFHARTRRPAAFFLVIIVVSFLLLLGTRGPAQVVYEWALFDAPAAEAWGWLVRAPEKFGFLFWFAVSTLLAFGLAALTTFRWGASTLTSHQSLLASVLVALLCLVFTLPKLMAGTWGPYVPIRSPGYYSAANAWLAQQAGDFRVLWLAPYEFGRMKGGEASHTWASDRFAGYVFPRSSSKPSFGGYHYTNPFARYRSFLYDSLDSPHLWKLLAPAGIRYVAYQADIVGADQRQAEDLAALGRNLKRIARFGRLHVFENEQFSPSLTRTIENFTVYGGLQGLHTLSEFGEFDPRRISLLFRDEEQTWPAKLAEETTPLLYDTSPEEVSAQSRIARFGHIIWPFEHVTNGEPGLGWARLRISSRFDGLWPWHTYLQDWLRELDRWEFDYGRGVITTYKSKSSIRLPFRVSESGGYELYGRILHHDAGGRIDFSIDGTSIASVPTQDSAHRFQWILLGEASLSEGEHTLTATSRQGHNAVNAIGMLPLDAPEDSKGTLKEFLFLGEARASKQGFAGSISLPEAAEGPLHILLARDMSHARLKFAPAGPDFPIRSDGGVGPIQMGPDVAGDYYVLAGKQLRTLTELPKLDWANGQTPQPVRGTEGVTGRLVGETEGWNTWRSAAVDFDSQDTLFLAAELSAQNMSDLHLKVEWSARRASAGVSYVTRGQTGSFRRLVGSYLSIPPRATSLRIQIVGRNRTPTTGSWTLHRLELIRVGTTRDYEALLAAPKLPFSGTQAIMAHDASSPSPAGPFVVGQSEGGVVRLAESYDPYWLAESDDVSGEANRLIHVPAFGAVNGFLLEDSGSESRVFYAPQFWLLQALGVIIPTAIGIGTVVWGRRRRRHTRPPLLGGQLVRRIWR